MRVITQGFQFRIQETLNVKDEQIDHLSQILIDYKEKILEYKEQIALLDSKIEEKKKELKQRIQNKQVTKGLSRSQKISSHHYNIIEIQAEQSQEIQDLQKDFKQKLARFHEFSREQMQDQDKSFDIEIQKLKKEIAETQSKIANFQKPEEEHNFSSLQIQNDIIKHLQKVAQQKSEERRSMLLDFKTQFSDYLEYINKLDSEHQKKLIEIQNQVDENSQFYKESLHNLKTQSHHEIKLLREKKKEAEKKLFSLSSQLSEMKETFSKSFNFSTKKFDAMKSLSFSKTLPENIPQNRELDQSKEKLLKYIESRKEKEMILKKSRDENFELKRQITVLRHSRRYPKM